MTVEKVIATQPGRLVLPAGGPLRAGLIEAFAGILAYAAAQEPGADPTITPAESLHEYRKSVRRARALLRLMEDVVGVAAYGQLADTLREVHRASSALRDRQVVLDVIQGAGPCTTDASATVMAESLGAAMPAEAAPSAAEIAAVIAAGRARCAPLPEILAGAMPRKVRWEAVIGGLTRTFRRARRRFQAALLRGDDESVHGLRKRIKELNYQVELFAELGGGRARKQRKRLGELSDELGRLADLTVLRGRVEALASTDEQARLLRVLAGERNGHLGQALEHAGDVLDRRPRRFARAIVRAARERHA
jgi:CHAD domain-containing protein